MNLSKALVILGAIVLAIAVGVVVLANRAGQSTGVNLQHISPVEPALAEKAREHCWFKAKSRLTRGKSSADGPAVSSAGAVTERLGDLILVTGATDLAVGDDRYYGCALFQDTEGSPVVVATKTSATPLRPDALVPFGFTSDGKKQ